MKFCIQSCTGDLTARVLMIAVVLIVATVPAYAENWIAYRSVKMHFPAGDTFVAGSSESSYDRDSFRYYEGTRVEARLKHITYIGDLVPHKSMEVVRIDCLRNTFESLAEGAGNPAVLTEIARGEIGSDSSYRIIKEAICGVPHPAR